VKNSSTSSFKSLLIFVAFLLPLYAVLVVLDNNLTNALVNSNHEDISFLQRAYSGEIDTEILVVGSSRALVHFDCETIEEQTKKTCFNLGMNGTNLRMQIPTLKQYLASNELPEVVVQEVGVTSLSTPPEAKIVYNQEQYAPFLDYGIIYEEIKELLPDAVLYKYFPFYEYIKHEDLLDDGLKARSGEVLKSRRQPNGFRPTTRKWDGKFEDLKEQYPNGRNLEIEKDSIEYLREIIDVVTDYGVEIVLVYTPEYYENQTLTTNRRQITDVYLSVAKNKGISYLDYSNDNITQDRDNFYNSQHLNAFAASDFSKIFSQDIKLLLAI